MNQAGSWQIFSPKHKRSFQPGGRRKHRLARGSSSSEETKDWCQDFILGEWQFIVSQDGFRTCTPLPRATTKVNCKIEYWEIRPTHWMFSMTELFDKFRCRHRQLSETVDDLRDQLAYHFGQQDRLYNPSWHRQSPFPFIHRSWKKQKTIRGDCFLLTAFSTRRHALYTYLHNTLDTFGLSRSSAWLLSRDNLIIEVWLKKIVNLIMRTDD